MMFRMTMVMITLEMVHNADDNDSRRQNASLQKHLDLQFHDMMMVVVTMIMIVMGSKMHSCRRRKDCQSKRARLSLYTS